MRPTITAKPRVPLWGRFVGHPTELIGIAVGESFVSKLRTATAHRSVQNGESMKELQERNLSPVCGEKTEKRNVVEISSMNLPTDNRKDAPTHRLGRTPEESRTASCLLPQVLPLRRGVSCNSMTPISTKAALHSSI